MRRYFTASAVIGVLLLGSFQAAFATNITDLLFEINTKDDEKEKTEPINFQILKGDTIVVYDSNWIFGNWLFKENAYNYKRAPWGGAKLLVPITTDDCPALKLRVEKMGGQSWKASFQVRANNRELILLTETPTVLFGDSHPIGSDKPLQGQKGAKATPSNSGNIHIFRFNCPPPDKK
ncbi:MAG TPA: hypothetical protein VN494_09910 [Patescibacteria group bacterium]|nr:hypothetical protein [Patescibacteria group bacterium]